MVRKRVFVLVTAVLVFLTLTAEGCDQAADNTCSKRQEGDVIENTPTEYMQCTDGRWKRIDAPPANRPPTKA